VLPTQRAIPAASAGNERIHRHAIAYPKVSNTGSEFGNLSTEFVTQYERRNPPFAFPQKAFKVRTADADRANPHEHRPGFKSRHWHVLQLEFPGRRIHKSPHHPMPLPAAGVPPPQASLACPG